MYRFFVTVHARPAEVGETSELALRGRTVMVLRTSPAILAATSFDCTFEEVYEQLATLERMFIEPDGSFVWTSSRAEATWQVDGQLYDRGGRLVFVDLKGNCPAAEFDRLLASLDWPRTPLVFQFTREAVVVEETEFRRLAGNG